MFEHLNSPIVIIGILALVGLYNIDSSIRSQTKSLEDAINDIREINEKIFRLMKHTSELTYDEDLQEEINEENEARRMMS